MGKLLLWLVFFLVPACLIVKAMFRKPIKKMAINRNICPLSYNDCTHCPFYNKDIDFCKYDMLISYGQNLLNLHGDHKEK